MVTLNVKVFGHGFTTQKKATNKAINNEICSQMNNHISPKKILKELVLLLVHLVSFQLATVFFPRPNQ